MLIAYLYNKKSLFLISIFWVTGCFDDTPTANTGNQKQTVESYQRSRPFDEGRGVNEFDANAPAIQEIREQGVYMPDVSQSTMDGMYQIEAMGVSVGGGCNKGQMTRGNEVRLTIKNFDLNSKSLARINQGRARWNNEVLLAAQTHGLDPHLIHGIISQESRYQEKILGPKTRYGYAKGLMQLIDDTGKYVGVRDPQQLLVGAININAGSKYFKTLMKRFNGNATLAVGGYNAGPGNITRCGNRISPYANGQTLDYVEKVLGYANANKRNPNPSSPKP